VAEKALVALGVEVTTAVDGVDALAKMREASFDLVFTDLEMPRMHGFELIRELRFLKAYQEIPIVVVTSRSGQKHQEQARSLGANEYLTKPFTAQSLAAAVETFGKKRARTEVSS
jgi:chemosensory pili system protein ChpA (sensor histidine kinase/response regulator)